MKKFTVILVTLSLLLTAVLPMSVYAVPGTPTFSITEVSGEAGDEVSVYLEISNSPTIHSFLLQIHYDKDLLELVAAEEVEMAGLDSLNLIMSVDPATGVPVPNVDQNGNYYFAVNYFGFYGLTDAEGIAGNRRLLKLTFEIKEDAPLGDTYIDIRYAPDDVFVMVPPYYMDIQNVHFATESGKINVYCDHRYGNWTPVDFETHYKSCSKCGDAISENHVWDEGVETPPTCVAEGEVCYTCTACGKQKFESIPATNEHIYGEWHETVPATETTVGEERRECKHCDAFETREIPMLPAFLLGDIDGNEFVDLDDCLVLFQYSMFPDIYPVEYTGNMDYDHNGVVDLDDCLALFQYSMFPDIYPIS